MHATMADSENIEPLPSVSFALAAIVRVGSGRQEYAIVHERPPRGWWLPGGGVEHHDATPVSAAVRESVEEAGSPSLLPLLSSSQYPTTNGVGAEVEEINFMISKQRLLPSMTHLISLEQSPGRIRFIFRGEWIDEYAENYDDHGSTPKSVLKCPPGDDDSVESRWITWDEVQCLRERKQNGCSNLPSIQFMSDPWLRGHEPITFFGLLDCYWRKNLPVPGLKVHPVNLIDKLNHHHEEVTGSFFGRMGRTDTSESEKAAHLTYHGRAALLTHLQCRLLVYNKVQNSFAIHDSTNTFPASFVRDQNQMSLKELVGKMISKIVSLPQNRSKEDRYQVGLLRVEHVVHSNSREATLSVFPFVHLSSFDGVFLHESPIERIRWVSAEELIDPLERRLAEGVIDDQSREKCLHFILRDVEGPFKYI